MIKNKEISRLNKIIKDKKSNICLAADVNNLTSLFELIDYYKNDICILKLHYDIIDDFNKDIDFTVKKLNQLKNEHNFLIWEDRKFADIGFIMEKQINKISNWADLVSIHPIAGEESVKQIKDVGIILIGEMSSKEHLFNLDYQKKVINISKKCDNVIGIVCQHKMTEDLLNIVPGISFNANKDDKGQKYNLPEDRQFADIFVVGRALYLNKNRENIEKLKKMYKN